MAQANVTQSNFLGGEFSPSAQGRLDLPQYREALALCRNAIPTETGGVVRRSGTKFVQPTRNADVASNFPVHPGDFSGYVVEMSNDNAITYFRYLHGGHMVTDAGTIISSINTSNPAQITMAAPVSWSSGDEIMIQVGLHVGQDAHMWSPLMNRTFRVSKSDTTHFTLKDTLTGANVDGSGFTSSIPSGTQAGRIKTDVVTALAGSTLPTVKAVQYNNSTVVFGIVAGTAARTQVLTLNTSQSASAFATFTLSALTMADGPYNAPVSDALTLVVISGTSYTFTTSTTTPFDSSQIGDPIRINLQPPQWASGTDYTTVSTVVSDALGNQWTNINASGANQSFPPAISPNYWAPYADGSVWVWGTITAVATNKSITVTIVSMPVDLGTGTNQYAPVQYQLAYFSDRGTSLWPTCGTFYESRLFCGDANNAVNATKSAGLSGTTATFSPTDKYGNVLDNSAIQETILGPGTNTIWWMQPDANGILFGTQTAEWFIQSTTLGNPVTPTSFQAHQFTQYGSTFIQPVRMGIAMSFIDRYNSRLFEYMTDPFGARFSGRPLNLYAKGITGDLTFLAYQDEPEPTLWSLGNAGLVSCTYRRISFFATEQPAFYAWANHNLGNPNFSFKSLCSSTVSNDSEDQLYLVTRNTDDRYFNEVLMPLWQDNDTLLTAWTLDEAVSGIDYGTLVDGSNDHGPVRYEGMYIIEDGGNMVFNGLVYFAGQTISVWLGGLDFGDYVVASDGTITVPYASDTEHRGTKAYLLGLTGANLAPVKTAWFAKRDLPSIPALIGSSFYNLPGLVGFPFTTRLQKMRPDVQQEAHSQLGPTTGDIKRHHWYALNLSAGVANTINVGGDQLVTYPASLDNYKTGQPTPTTTLFTGIFRDTVDSDYDLDGQLYITVTRPAPMSLVGWAGMVQAARYSMGVFDDLFGGGQSLMVPGTSTPLAGDTFNTSFGGNGGGGNTGGLLDIAGTAIGAGGSLIGANAKATASATEAEAYSKEAELYNQAATVAGQDITLAKVSGQLQASALSRKIAQTEGTAAAVEGAANVGTYLPHGTEPTGTGAYILAESQRQGQMAMGQLNLQTQLQENNFQQMQLGFQAQAAGAEAAAKAAEAASKSGGGIMGALGSVVGIASKIFGMF